MGRSGLRLSGLLNDGTRRVGERGAAVLRSDFPRVNSEFAERTFAGRAPRAKPYSDARAVHNLPKDLFGDHALIERERERDGPFIEARAMAHHPAASARIAYGARVGLPVVLGFDLELKLLDADTGRDQGRLGGGDLRLAGLEECARVDDAAEKIGLRNHWRLAILALVESHLGSFSRGSLAIGRHQGRIVGSLHFFDRNAMKEERGCATDLDSNSLHWKLVAAVWDGRLRYGQKREASGWFGRRGLAMDRRGMVR